MRKVGFVRKLFAMALAGTMCVIICLLLTGQPMAVKAETADNVTPQFTTSSQQETVVSYVDIFESYYQQATTEMAEDGIEIPYTFQEFCDGYYQFGMDLQSYTELLVAEANGTVNMSDYEVAPMSSSSGDASYIIKGGTANPNSATFDPAITPKSAFQRIVNYGKFDFSNIRVGDILLETATILNDIGHTAFVYDLNKAAESGSITGRSTYIQTIEAVRGGVQFGFLDDTRMVDYGVVVLRATTNSTAIGNAKYFTYCQLGQDYDFPLQTGRANTSIHSNEWYCSELNRAAYLYAGVNLSGAVTADGWVWPYNLMYSASTDFVSVSGCLDVRLLGKANGKWKIRVYNRTGATVSLQFNSKLAFFDDAKDWRGLNDVDTSKTVYNNSYTDILISTNAFATTAAISYQKPNNGKRYVTYCDGINNATLRMRVRKNLV